MEFISLGKTFLSSKGEKKTTYRGLNTTVSTCSSWVGQAVYYHHDDIQHFLTNVHGTANDLLKPRHGTIKGNR